MDVTCCVRMQTMLNVVVCCCVLLGVVPQSLKPVKLLSQQLPVPIFLLFHDRRCWNNVGSMLDQCWIHLHTSSNIVVVGHACALHKDTPHFETIPRCTAGRNTAGSYCIPLHTTAATNATTPNIACPTILEVVVSVCK